MSSGTYAMNHRLQDTRTCPNSVIKLRARMEGVLPMMALSNSEAENATASINDFATLLVRSTPYVFTTPRTIAPSKITRGGPDGIMNVMTKSMRMKAIRMRPKEV